MKQSVALELKRLSRRQITRCVKSITAISYDAANIVTLSSGYTSSDVTLLLTD